MPKVVPHRICDGENGEGADNRKKTPRLHGRPGENDADQGAQKPNAGEDDHESSSALVVLSLARGSVVVSDLDQLVVARIGRHVAYRAGLRQPGRV